MPTSVQAPVYRLALTCPRSIAALSKGAKGAAAKGKAGGAKGRGKKTQVVEEDEDDE